jgi:hypothetical protein
VWLEGDSGGLRAPKLLLAGEQVEDQADQQDERPTHKAGRQGARGPQQGQREGEGCHRQWDCTQKGGNNEEGARDASMLIPLLPERADESHTDGFGSKRSARSFLLMCTAPSHRFVPYNHPDYDHI